MIGFGFSGDGRCFFASIRFTSDALRARVGTAGIAWVCLRVHIDQKLCMYKLSLWGLRGLGRFGGARQGYLPYWPYKGCTSLEARITCYSREMVARRGGSRSITSVPGRSFFRSSSLSIGKGWRRSISIPVLLQSYQSRVLLLCLLLGRGMRLHATWVRGLPGMNQAGAQAGFV